MKKNIKKLAVFLGILLTISVLVYFFIRPLVHSPYEYYFQHKVTEISFEKSCGNVHEYLIVLKRNSLAEFLGRSYFNPADSFQVNFPSTEFALIAKWFEDNGFFDLKEEYHLAPTEITPCKFNISISRSGKRKNVAIYASEDFDHPDFYGELSSLWAMKEILCGVAERIRRGNQWPPKDHTLEGEKPNMTLGFPKASGYFEEDGWIAPDFQVNKPYDLSDINDLVLSLFEANVAKDKKLIKEITLPEAPASIIYGLSGLQRYRITEITPIENFNLGSFLTEEITAKINIFEVHIDLEKKATIETEKHGYIIAERNGRLYFVKEINE